MLSLNSDSGNINHLSLTELDTILFNPLHFQENEDTNSNSDSLSYNPSKRTNFQSIYLNKSKAQPCANNVFPTLYINIRSLTSNLQSFIVHCQDNDFVNYDIIDFSETRLDNYIPSLSNIPDCNLCTTTRQKWRRYQYVSQTLIIPVFCLIVV